MKANLKVWTFSVQCPHCLEDCMEPVTGSFMWEVDAVHQGQEAECSECGGPFTLPVRVAENRLFGPPRRVP